MPVPSPVRRMQSSSWIFASTHCSSLNLNCHAHRLSPLSGSGRETRLENITTQPFGQPTAAHASLATQDNNAQRSFLFLQGPPGPFFRALGGALAAAGCAVRRINLNGGDMWDWRAPVGGIAADVYRGRITRWGAFVDGYMRRHGITDLVLFGDCRPMHMVAHSMARLIGIRVHVFEEGYIRPNWLTLERDGVNGHSPLPRTAEAIREAARGLPQPPDLPPIGAKLGRRVKDTWGYFRHMVWGAAAFPFYRSHRPGSIVIEGFGWCRYQLVKRARARATAATLATLPGRRYFLLPLQLTSDYQIRIHSPFPTMRAAADYVIASFATHAPADTLLVVKDHPLDYGWFDWGAYVRRRAHALGIAGRLVHLPGGDLKALADGSVGLVTVNSTSATFALADGVPVAALGTAVYALPGLVHAGPLDAFWAAPPAPDPSLWDAFCRVLHRHCLVRGGLASESAMRILIANALPRLLRTEEAGTWPGLRAVD